MTPVQLQNLPPTATLKSDGFTHYNDGTTDFRSTVAQMQAVIISALNTINVPQPTDLMMVSQNGVTGKVYFSQVGFTAGTTMWFYQSIAPINWTSVGLTDSVLAIAGGSNSYNVAGGNQAGTWQQSDVGGVPNQGLDITQIPAHTHGCLNGPDSNRNGQRFLPANGVSANLSTLSTGGTSPDYPTTSMPHNHGAVWRPTAAVGLLCRKST